MTTSEKDKDTSEHSGEGEEKDVGEGKVEEERRSGKSGNQNRGEK